MQTNDNKNNEPQRGPESRASAFAGKRKKIDKNTLVRLLEYLKEYKAKLVFVAICIVVSSVTGVIGSMFIQSLIDDYIVPIQKMPVPNYSGLLAAISILAGIYVAGIIANYIYNVSMVKISQGIMRKIRDEMFSKMQRLPIGYFDSHPKGQVMSYYTNDVDTLEELLERVIPMLFSSVITIVAVYFAMLYLSIWLALFILLFVFFMLKFMKNLGGKSSKYFIGQQSSMAELNGYIEEMVNGQKIIKVFCHEEETKIKFDEKNEKLCLNATNANKFANTMMPIMGNLGDLQYVLVAIIGSTLAINGFVNIGLSGVNQLTLGSIASFLLLTKTFKMPINQISQQINSAISAFAGAKRIFELMDEIPEQDQGTVTLVNIDEKDKKIVETDKRTNNWAWKKVNDDGSVTYTKLRGDVRLNHVTFGYIPDKIVLHDVSLFAKPGQKIAFVGATGAGKTTITNLINRFYDINEGEILYDGINIKDIKKEDLRMSIGMVLQDINVFSGTIMENIRYGRLDATDEECIEAAKLANAHNFISHQPDGYNTYIGNNGKSLSQGQLQLLSIARAAVANPPVMILDEATSSIDTRTEAIVQKGMDSLMKGRTVFVIAHRLSTVQNSEAIMVLDKGRIIERGNHDDLIEQKGKYYTLYMGTKT